MVSTMSSREPTVEEVLRFEDLPVGSLASRRAVVRWSDGSEGEATGSTAMRPYPQSTTSDGSEGG
jgi:hypothetical protein